jgi:hypothetical protein
MLPLEINQQTREAPTRLDCSVQSWPLSLAQTSTLMLGSMPESA